MNSFWQTWRKEIIRGVVLFCGVIAIGLCIRYVVVRARQGVMDNLPVALRGLRGLRDLKNLPNNFDFDPDAYGGPRDTADTWTYQAKVVPQHWVWIRNTVGSVRVEAAKGDSLEVVAVKTHRRSDPGSVHIETVKVADGIAICAVWAHGGGRCVPGEDYKPSSPHRSDVAVDFTVRLPRRVRLGASTVNGAVHVANATAPLVLASVNGEVDAETSAGPVRATSVNGSVRARMRAFGDTGEVALFTVNGTATVELPGQLDADVEASTVNGAIETDYPLVVTGKLGKHLQGKLGAGGRKVRITTVNGSINLRKATHPS